MYRITTQFDGLAANGGGVNHLYFDQGAGTGAQAHAAVAAFWNAAKTYVSNTTTMTVLGEIELVDNATGQVEAVESTDQVSIAGAGAGNLASPVLQCLIRWRTGVFVNGRELRGRTFVPGVQTNSLSAGGTVAATTVSGLNNAGGSLIGAANADLVVWSKTHGMFETVTSASTWSKFATLRSRRD